MEQNAEEWREIRGRADSIANAVFLLGGGAVSVSIATLLSSNAIHGVALGTKYIVICAWGLLLYSVVTSLVVKFLLVVQAYKRLSSSPKFARWHAVTTYSNWSLAITGLLSFVSGMVVLGWAASCMLLQYP
jgi:hypothetical protein